MTEALKCPECSASLEYPADGGVSMRCPYCNSTVLLPGRSPVAGAGPTIDLGAAFGPMIGNAVQLAEVVQRLKAGDKIGAIRVYRQTFNADLSTAKTAVEKVAEHHQINPAGSRTLNYKSPDPVKAASSALAVGCALTVGILLLTAMIVFFALRSARHQFSTAATATRSWTPTPMTLPPIPRISGMPSTADTPAFAHKVLEFGSEGVGAGGFADARSIATDGQGHFYVGNYSDGRIQVFDADGKFISMWSIGSDKYLLNLSADRHGIVYVVESQHIYKYEGATGTPQGEVDTSHDDVREFCTDAFAALNGHIYAVASNSNILDIGADNQMKHVIDAREKVGEEVDFERIAVLGTGEIFALDRTKGIFKFAADGHYINRFGGGHGSGPGHLNSPRNLAADGKGRIYVTDSGGAAVQVFDDEGSYLGSFGGRDVAFGLTITDQNEIYACFRNKNCVRKFVLDEK